MLALGMAGQRREGKRRQAAGGHGQRRLAIYQEMACLANRTVILG